MCTYISNSIIVLLFYYFRIRRETRVMLRKVLADSSKARRHRRNHLNINSKINLYLVKHFRLFTFLLGSVTQNSISTLALQPLSAIIYFCFIIYLFDERLRR